LRAHDQAGLFLEEPALSVREPGVSLPALITEKIGDRIGPYKLLQHAHQKGIIHRDVKPSNILVTLHDGQPMPKVIDFGIAKATDQRLTDKTLFTAFELFIGTPAYTSPEQAEMSTLHQGVGPSVAQGRDTTMLREVLDLTAARVGRDLKEQPETEAELRMTLGEVYQALGRYDQAEEMYREALAIWKAGHVDHAPRARTELIAALLAQRKFTEAKALQAEAVAEAGDVVETMRKSPPSEARVEALLRWITALCRHGQIVDAERALAEVLDTARPLPSWLELAEGVFLAAIKISVLQVWFGREAEHGTLCGRMIEWAVAQPGRAPKVHATAVANLRPLTDPQIHSRALSFARQILNDAPTNATLSAHQLRLGVAAYRLGHDSEADRWLIASQQGDPGSAHPKARTCTSQFFRAMILFRQGQPDLALRLFTECEAKMPPLPEAVEWALTEGTGRDDVMVWLAFKEARAL
jgi:tetratricopeptide (TPR) repeat protein